MPGPPNLPSDCAPYGLALGLGVPYCGEFGLPPAGVPSALFWYIPGPTVVLGCGSELKPTAGGLPVVEYGLALGTSFRMLRQPEAEKTIPRASVKQQPAKTE